MDKSGVVCSLTCIALMFSVNWSILEAPSSTEFTLSFLKHQAFLRIYNTEGKGEDISISSHCYEVSGIITSTVSATCRFF